MNPADTVSMALVVSSSCLLFFHPRRRRGFPGSFRTGGFGFFAGAEQEPAGESPSPVGFILCRMAGEDCEVLSFGVDHQIRGAGLGFRLLGAAVIGAKVLTATRMVLEVALDNKPALDIYEKWDSGKSVAAAPIRRRRLMNHRLMNNHPGI